MRSDPCHGGYQFQSVVDQTLLAALPDHGDHVGENDGETSTLETSQIPSCLTKSQKSIKMLIRSQHGLSLQREERHHLWMGLYHKREGSESRAIHADVFRDSLQSCFGSKEEDTYGFLTSLCSSRHPKYFSQTKQQHEVDWQTVKELNNKYNRPICSELISVVGEDNVDDLFKSWMFWILDYLPFPHVVRIVDCFLAEGQKLLFRCCLSILRQFGKVIRANPSKRQVIQKEGLNSTFIRFCREIPVDAQETAKDNFQMFPINNLKSEFLTPGQVFGAYCSTSWAERKYKDDRGLRQAYFGTGETFLFQIDLRDPSECIIYPWVRKNTQNEDVTLTKAEKHAQELFMSGQTDMISIGGGNGCAIFLDSSLRFGRSEHCETFNNPPLCQGKDFEVSVVEVYGLNLLDL
eukprot:TCALIF_05378-PA protein Name:"Similar to tbc1d24 TBC1 domain family member 24 (Xenopus laevis)" AED:0.19 eAED:0.19 QI:0/0.5/0.77/0.88/0.5/0.66/9/149/405